MSLAPRAAVVSVVLAVMFVLAACQTATLGGKRGGWLDSDDSKVATEPPEEIIAPERAARIEPPPVPDEPRAPAPAEQPPPPPEQDELAPMSPELAPPSRQERPVIVAVLLPLSGPRAELGKLLLDAAQLALFDVGGDELELRPFDTTGNPETAAVVARAATSEGAELILGPVFSKTTAAAAVAAREAGISLVSYSNNRRVAGNGVFLMGLLPRQQIDRVVAFASGRGLRRYAALIPDTAYGSAVLDALKEAITKTGGDLVAIEYYGADAADADQHVRNLARLGAYNYDAILLPEGGANLRAFAALLPYHDIHPDKVRYVGTTLWSDPTVGREPALVGGWFAGPAPELGSIFHKRFVETYGHAPPRIASLVYDSVALAAALARQRDFSAGAVSSASGFAGIDGIFRFGRDGIAERGLAVLEVTPDGLRTVSEAPTTFQALSF